MFDIEHPLQSREGREPPARILLHGKELSFQDDCLLLTVLPNPYASSAGADDLIEVIAARHRAGMMAAELVFSDSRLLDRILKKTRGLSAWQTVIPVKTPDQITLASLGEEEVFEINADFDKLHATLAGHPFLSDPALAEQYALLGSPLAVGPREVLDHKWQSSGGVRQESRRTKPKSTPSDPMRSSGEENRNEASNVESAAGQEGERAAAALREFRRKLEMEREPALGPEAAKYVKELINDKNKAIAFLKEIGVLDETGEMPEEFRA